MTPEYLRQLQQHLPVLGFDSGKDKPSAAWPLCQQYLDYYQLPRPPGVKHYLGAMMEMDYRLATQYWVQAAPIATVVVLHGYFDHVGLYGHLIRYLLEKNYNVVAFDLPGHGLSSGEKVSIESFHHYVQCFSVLLENIKDFKKPVHALGQSTGGAILLNYLLVRTFLFQPVELEKVITLAPLIKPAHWIRGRLLYWLLHRFRKKVRRRFLVNSSNEHFQQFVSEDPLQTTWLSLDWVTAMKQWIHDFRILPKSEHPITIVQGERDLTVDWQYNCKAVARKFPNSRLVRIDGANHHLVNEAPGLRGRVFEAIDL